MIELNEYYPDPMADRVHFQMPEDLKIKNHIPEILHDEDDELEGGGVKIFPGNTQIHHDTSITYNPLSGIDRLKMDPTRVPIARHGDNFYIDHKDLHCYMDSCGEKSYEEAVENIIMAHDDPDFTMESTVIVMGKNDLSNMDYDTRNCMEESNVRFEIY